MSQVPRWYRRRYYEQKLANVLQNPYADQASVAAARAAVDEKLRLDDIKFQQQQVEKKNKYLKELL